MAVNWLNVYILKSFFAVMLTDHCCYYCWNFLCPSSSAFCRVVLVAYRYLFALQIKRDLANGILACQEHTAVLLASFVVQGMECHVIKF